jgi:hypothetical protein
MKFAGIVFVAMRAPKENKKLTFQAGAVSNALFHRALLRPAKLAPSDSERTARRRWSREVTERSDALDLESRAKLR